MSVKTVHVKKLAVLMVFSALGVAIAPFFWFWFLGTKAYPTQHMINAILGVLIGPFWAAIAAIFIGIIRNMLGIGTFYAFPGGIPGGIVVGVVYWLFKRFKLNSKVCLVAALSEPIGTLLIGVPLSVLIIIGAPYLGTEKLLNLLGDNGFFITSLVLMGGWALSCVPGSIIGFIILLILDKVGINRETLFGEK